MNSEPLTFIPHSWLQPIPLPGGRMLPNHILPGPMEGITTGAFCSAMAELGLVRCWISPFVRVSTGVPRKARLRGRLRPFLDTGLPLVAQVMGVDIDNLAGTAARLCELPFVVGVDLNCGCPSRQVISSGAGGARLRSPQWIRDALLALRAACPNHGVSIKLRAGLDSPDELPDILAVVRDAMPDMVILHYRTVAENYVDVPRGWDRLARARDLLPGLRLIGSGDLFTVDDAMHMYRTTGVDGVAPARGLLRTPQLLQDIELACEGKERRTDSEALPLRLLLAMAEAQQDLPPKALMKLAAHSIGEGTPLFRELVTFASMSELRARIVEELQRRGILRESEQQ